MVAEPTAITPQTPYQVGEVTMQAEVTQAVRTGLRQSRRRILIRFSTSAKV